MKRQQRGLSLIGMMIIGLMVIFAAVIVIKTVPAVIEYLTIKKAINALVAGGETRGATVADIRRAFDKRATIDDIKSVTASDLDISKEGGEVVIAVAYSKKVELWAPVSLCLDFETSTSPGKARAAP